MMTNQRYTPYALLGLAIATLLVGCAQPRPFDDLWVDQRPYQAQQHPVKPPSDVLQSDRLTEQDTTTANPDGSITLHDAIALALRQSPTLKAAGWSVAAAEADALQFGRPKNPRAMFMIEKLGQGNSEPTLRISQVIELSDKRDKRLKLGQAKQRLQAWDYEQLRIEIAATTAERYVAVAVAQQRVELAQQQLAIAESAYAIAYDRAENGTRPGYERDQAAARVALSQIELEQATQRLSIARADLAAVWGAKEPAFQFVTADLTQQIELPSLETLQARLPQSPHLARWEDEIAQRKQAIELERANAVTDPTLGGGVRYLSEIDEAAGVAEVSWPLPLFDKNEHGILAARLRLSQARAQQQAVQAERTRQLSRAHVRAVTASNTLKTLSDRAIPAAQAAHDATRQAYEAGQTDYLTTLETERALLDLQRLQLETALTYHTAIIDLEHTTASPIQPATPASE